MKTRMLKNGIKNVPVGVFFIVAIYVFGALIILAWIFIDPVAVSSTIAKAHGFLPIMGIEVVLVVALLTLALAYGLVRLSRWGFILTIAYSLYMGFINLISASQALTWEIRPGNMLYFGNFIFSVLVIVYLLIVRRSFFSTRERR